MGRDVEPTLARQMEREGLWAVACAGDSTATNAGAVAVGEVRTGGRVVAAFKPRRFRQTKKRGPFNPCCRQYARMPSWEAC